MINLFTEIQHIFVLTIVIVIIISSGRVALHVLDNSVFSATHNLQL
jgi:hypothetical protein